MDQLEELLRAEEEQQVETDKENVDIVIGTSLFHPDFIYPIYGDTERIQGYTNPHLTITFDESTLLPLVEFKYEGEPEPNAEDPVKILLDHMSKDTVTSKDEWLKIRDTEIKDFVVPGTQIGEFGDYTVQKATLSECADLLERFKIFILFLIEAGSYIDLGEKGWEIYLLYTKSQKFAGFATVHSFLYYSTGAQFEATPNLTRARISQFAILPPYQHQRVGQGLYSVIMDYLTAQDTVKQVSVEDPNEGFDDMRDRADLARLSSDKEFQSLELPIDKTQLETLAEKFKMVQRQFSRCVEMSQLQKHPDEPQDFRKLVKERMWAKNYHKVDDQDPAMLKELFKDGYASVVDDYRRILHLEDNPRKRRRVQ